MSEARELFIGLAGFCIGMVVLMVFMSVIRLRRLLLQRMAWSAIPKAELPDGERALFDTAAPRLEALGFVHAFAVLARNAYVLPGKEHKFLDIHLHSRNAVIAVVELPESPDYGEPVSVMFVTEHADGTSAQTTNRTKHGLLPMPPAIAVHDDYLRSFELAYHAHVGRMEASGKAVERDAAVLRQRSIESAGKLFQWWIDAGVIVPTREPDRWRLGWATSFRFVVKVFAGMGRAQRAKPAARAPSAVDSVGTILFLESQHAVLKSIEGSKDDKHLLTVLSIVAFAALGVWIWDWIFMLVLFGVIGLHEMGHYFAMRIVGYRNVHVFFVPGLGALATGQKADASPLQKVFVYLAGPVPGLVLCFAIAIAMPGILDDTDSWKFQLVMVAFVVNFLNLLPVTPLDGGRVAEALLFAKVPLFRLLFAGTCALALLGAGLYLGDWVLRIVGLAVVMSLPHQWRVYRIESALPPRDGALPEPQAMALVFETASGPRFARWSDINRGAAAMALVGELQARKPRWGEVAIGLAIYGACLAPPILVAYRGAEETGTTFLGTQWGEGPKAKPSKPPRDWKSEIARAADQPPAKQLEVILAAIDAGYPTDDDDVQSGSVAAQAWALAGSLPLGDRRRSKALLAYARAADESGGDQRVLEAEKELSLTQGDDRLLYAQLLETMAESAPTRTAAIDSLRRALAIRDSLRPGGYYSTMRTRSTLARRLYVAGSRDEAGRLLAFSVEESSDRPIAKRWAWEREYGAYLVNEGRGAQAEVRLKKSIASARSASGGERKLAWLEEESLRQLLWAQLVQSTPDASARARTTLDEIEANPATERKGRDWKEIAHHQLDRLAVAVATADQPLSVSAMAHLAAIFDRTPAKPSYCSQYTAGDVERRPWDRHRFESHAYSLQRLGYCPSSIH